MAKLLTLLFLYSCAGGKKQSTHGLSESSSPINPKESIAYKKAILRCHKTGGTRIVKIKGILRCY